MPVDDAPLPPVEGSPGNSKDAFLSYSSSDKGAAERICALLEGAGISVWLAPRDVPAGANYADAIVRAINACRTLVVILSEHSVSSAHVSKEIERASSKRRPIVAVRVDDGALTPALEYFLSESQWIDARDGVESSLPKLIEGIRHLTTPGAAAARAGAGPPASLSPAAVVARPTHLLPLGIAVAAVVLGGGFLAQRAGWFRHAVGVAAVDGNDNTAAVAPAPAKQKSIAVLPFADLSERKDQEYFSDGLSEELIDLLGKVPGLRVSARTSSFYFKGKQATLAEIGKALNVSHVLEGSVRKSGKALRISTELVNISDDSRVWSETYDRQLDDVFKVQDDIAGSVVSALKVSMLGEPAPRSAPTTNSDAYLHFLLAREAGRDDGSFERTLSELNKAVAADPSFAEAWVALGTLRINGFVGSVYGPYEVARRAALDALQHALAIDPGRVDAHVELARIYFQMDFDTEAAEAELKRTRLDASGFSLWLTGYIANSEGRFDEAITLHKRARELDPLEFDNYRQLGNAYYRAGRLDEAAAVLSDAAQRFPAAHTVHYRLGLVRLAQHRPEDALPEFKLEQHDVQGDDFQLVGPPLALYALGRKSEADQMLGQVLASKTAPDAAAYQIALIYAARGNADATFQWLQRALQQRDAGMHWMKFDPLLKGFAADPRFHALLIKMHQT
jgi:TolB-like protein/tetratricopeptide (TPR) repeat protein